MSITLPNLYSDKHVSPEHEQADPTLTQSCVSKETPKSSIRVESRNRHIQILMSSYLTNKTELSVPDGYIACIFAT